MHKVLVCDDEIEITKTIVTLLQQCADLYDIEVTGFYNVHDLMEYCNENSYDVIYMDIEIGKDNGLVTAQKLKGLNPDALIIYISSHSTYYVEMVQAEPFRFIYKDFKDMTVFEREVLDTLELAMRRICRRKIWTYKFKRERYALELWKIEYFYSHARKIYIVGDIGDKPNYFYGKMNDLQKELDTISDNFLRIGKRYLINMRYIKWTRTDRKTKIMLKDKLFTLSDDYYEEYFERYLKISSNLWEI